MTQNEPEPDQIRTYLDCDRKVLETLELEFHLMPYQNTRDLANNIICSTLNCTCFSPLTTMIKVIFIRLLLEICLSCSELAPLRKFTRFCRVCFLFVS